MAVNFMAVNFEANLLNHQNIHKVFTPKTNEFNQLLEK